MGKAHDCCHEEDIPTELREMSRRFWVSLIFTVLLVGLMMIGDDYIQT